MPTRNRVSRRALNLVPALLAAATLAGCASQWDNPPRPESFSGYDRGVTFDTGRLMVVVVDQNGRAIPNARIDVDALHPERSAYRNSGTLDWRGSVSFNGVPEQVRVTVNHPLGYFSTPYVVASSGTTELRMIVPLEEAVPGTGPATPEPRPAPTPGRPGR